MIKVQCLILINKIKMKQKIQIIHNQCQNRFLIYHLSKYQKNLSKTIKIPNNNKILLVIFKLKLTNLMNLIKTIFLIKNLKMKKQVFNRYYQIKKIY